MSTVLITGASFGLGADFATLFAADKYELILVARSEDRLMECQNKLQAKYGVKVHVIASDLANSEAAFGLKAELDRRNLKVDVLVNNAGFGEFGLFHEIDAIRQQQMIELNVTTLTILTRLLVPDMIKRKQGKKEPQDYFKLIECGFHCSFSTRTFNGGLFCNEVLCIVFLCGFSQ